ncbi:MAG: VWA domain-containing protein [Sphaerochaetaceae bacterium]|nr:VWA domain-containing protein [Sphaerochaetaceae bacterium]
MRKDLTELVFILDRSGSMRGLESDTIGGFNAMLAKQKKEQGEALVSTVLFDDVCEVLHDRVDIRRIEDMTDKQYFVRGCTALLDAIGGAIHHIANVHKYIREEDRPEKTLFIITTDGMENASRQYSIEKVKEMVELEKEKYGWQFIFMGANIDAIATASRFGVDKEFAVNYVSDHQGAGKQYQTMSKVVSHVRRAKSTKEMKLCVAESLKELNADYEKRGRKK